MRARREQTEEPGVVVDATEPASLQAIFDALVSADWSPMAFAAHLPLLLAQRATLAAHARTGWLVGMREVARRGWALPGDARDAWMTLLADWSDWPLLLALAEQGWDERERPDWATRLVAQARFQLGDHDGAMACTTRAMLLSPDAAWANDAYRAHEAWAGFLRATAPPIAGEGLWLEPLGHQHLADFAWQYWDPEIARRCCLPTFAGDADWHRWLDDCWRWGDQRLYAVLHPAWGFVGSVSLTLHAGLGFFYYWIGRDFQGQGIGPDAVRILLDDAHAHRGMTACYAKVFEDNAPSRRALARIGFELLDFRPAPPNADEMFYRLGPPQPRARSVEELRGLFGSMGSGTQVAVPISDPLRAASIACGAPIERRTS